VCTAHFVINRQKKSGDLTGLTLTAAGHVSGSELALNALVHQKDIL